MNGRDIEAPSVSMIDHILGKPSPAFKRAQVFLVIMFWSWRLYVGDLKRKSKTRARVVGELFGSGWVGRRGGFLGIMGLINRKLSKRPDRPISTKILLFISDHYYDRAFFTVSAGRRHSDAHVRYP